MSRLLEAWRAATVAERFELLRQLATAETGPEWLSVTAYAHRAAVEPRTVRRWIQKDALTVQRVGPGRRVRILWSGCPLEPGHSNDNRLVTATDRAHR